MPAHKRFMLFKLLRSQANAARVSGQRKRGLRNQVHNDEENHDDGDDGGGGGDPGGGSGRKEGGSGGANLLVKSGEGGTRANAQKSSSTEDWAAGDGFGAGNGKGMLSHAAAAASSAGISKTSLPAAPAAATAAQPPIILRPPGSQAGSLSVVGLPVTVQECLDAAGVGAAAVHRTEAGAFHVLLF